MNLARPLSFAFLAATALAAVCAPISCWPLGPSGAELDASGPDASDAYVPPVGEAGSSGDGATMPTGEGGSSTSEGGSSADASTDGALDAAPDTYVPPPYPAATLATGLSFGCRIDATNIVWCWGANDYGQAGRPLPPAADDGGPMQVALPNDAGFLQATALALGNDHACAIVAGGGVYCWGRNDWDQLGHAPQGLDTYCHAGACNATPTPADSGVAVASLIAAAGDQTCVVGSTGAVVCWGDAGGASVVPSAAIPGIAELSMAVDHTCALIADAGTGAPSSVLCWGDNSSRQISAQFCENPGTTLCPPWDAAVPNPVAVAAGDSFTCIAAADAGVSCVGDNTAGELGHPTNTSNDQGDDAGFFHNGTPVAVDGIAGTIGALAASGNGQAVCVLASGTVSCWGAGNSTPAAVTNLPASMASLGAADGTYVCAQARDGGIWCWNVSGSATQVQ